MSQFPMDFNTLYGMYQQRRMMNQPSPLAAAYNQQFNMGNYNNEARYGDIIGGRTGIYDRNMDRISSIGAQDKADLNQRADQQLARQRSDLVSRGLGGTTVRQSIERGSLRERNDALKRISDQIARQQIATDSSLADNVYATMERRNDITPDLGQLAQLQQAVGASGMYGQYPGYSGPGMGHIGGGGYQPPAPRFELHGAGGRPQNGIPRPSIGNMGPGSIPPADPSRPPNGATPFPGGGYTYQGRPPSSGPIAAPGGVQRPVTMPGTGGSAGGYPLPGGGSSTPTYMPQPFPGPGGGGGSGYGGGQLPPGYKPYDGQWGYIMPGGGNRLPGQAPPDPALMISKYRDGDRVGQAMESQLLSQLRSVGQPRPGGYRPSAGYGSQQPQGGGMIRTAGDIQNSPFDANGRLFSVPRNPGYVGSAPATGYRPATTTLPGEFQGFYGGMPSVPQFDMAPQSYNYSGPGSYGKYPGYNMQTRQFLNATRDVKPVRQADPKRRPAGPLGPTRFFMQ